jgi:S-DNA-T family DNA segregation ATPase FtsK/SpoIIIE
VLTDPAAVLEWLPEWQAASPEGWRMLLVDDAHLWERGWEAGGPAREAVAALAATVDAAGPGLAVVVATDTDDARSRQHVAGMVQAARRGRRGMLLQPDLADGGLLGVTVPMHSVEPMIGIGRGLWCNRSAVAVVQTVAVQVTSVTSPEEDES